LVGRDVNANHARRMAASVDAQEKTITGESLPLLRLQPHRQHQRLVPGVRHADDCGGEGVRRWAFNLASVVSLLLCAGTAALWVRSYWRADAVAISSEQRAFQCGIASGRLRLGMITLLEEGGRWQPGFAQSHYPAEVDPPTRRFPITPANLGFAAEHVMRGRNNDSWLVMVPLWLPLLLFAGTALAIRTAAGRLLRAERRRRGLCPSCGYDVIATPDRCPECGAVPANR
jgi:hypothetical protein